MRSPQPRRASSAIARSISLLVLASAGCCWVDRDGPVPLPLLECRQLSSRGMAAMQRQDYAQAENLLAQAVDRYGLDPEARRLYAEALWQRGERDGAMAELNQAIELTGDDAALLARRAQWYLAAGDAAAADADAQRALDADPTATSAWLVLARLARQRGDSHGALAAYHRVLSYQAAHREALWEKAQLHWELSAAPALGEETHDSHTHDQQAHEQQAHDHHAHLAQAWMTTQALLAAYPPGTEPTDALLMAGRIQARQGRHEDAAELLAAANRRRLQH